MINIQGIHKAKVIQALFNHSKQQGFGFFNTAGASPIGIKEAEHLISSNQQGLYFDYVLGRVIKCDISKDEFNPWLYDRDNGEGAAQRAIDSIDKTTLVY